MNTCVQKSLEGSLVSLCPLRAGVRCGGDLSMWMVNLMCFSSKKPMPMLYCLNSYIKKLMLNYVFKFFFENLMDPFITVLLLLLVQSLFTK